MEAVDPPRALTAWEAEAVMALAPAGWAFDASKLRVHERCACGCASVSFLPEVQAHVVVGEAEADDADGMLIWVLLFGTHEPPAIHEIEVQRADGKPIQNLPAVASFRSPSGPVEVSDYDHGAVLEAIAGWRLPRGGRTDSSASKNETLRVALTGLGTAVVEGWVRDRRRRMELRVTLPDGRVIEAEGSRRSGWFLRFPGDEMSEVGSSDLHGGLLALLGYWNSPNEPGWIASLTEEILR